jgi:hypothetical protein
MSGRWSDALEVAKASGPPALSEMKPEAKPMMAPQPVPVPSPAAPPPARARMIDRRDGGVRLKCEYVEGKIRGGKRSDQWGRPRSGHTRDGWVGVSLPPATKARLKLLQAVHDLYEWQVLVEAIDLFAKLHGEGKDPSET